MRYRTGRYDAKPRHWNIGHEVVPADVQDASLAPYMKRMQSVSVSLYEGPGLRAVE